MQSFARACSFSIATLQWHAPVPGLGPELCHDQSHVCLGFPRPRYRECVTVALGVSSVMVSGLAGGSGMRAPLWPILPSTDTRAVSVVLRVKVLRSTHNYRAPAPVHSGGLSGSVNRHYLARAALRDAVVMCRRIPRRRRPPASGLQGRSAALGFRPLLKSTVA